MKKRVKNGQKKRKNPIKKLKQNSQNISNKSRKSHCSNSGVFDDLRDRISEFELI
jgi:hypothetical protein